jgi:glycosyltransferase involved in cell wall biosynthesis
MQPVKTAVAAVEPVSGSEGEYPKVSVAVVTYNQKDFIRECIESVLIQDYPNMEIVIGDDGSTDGTQQILAQYEKEYPGRFIFKMSPVNQGITKGHNSVQFACTGKYIAWLAGDDLMLPGKIRAQVEFMEKHPDCMICYHKMDVFDSKTGKTLHKSSDLDRPREGDVRTVLQYGTFNCGSSNMVRRSACPSHGFDERLPIASDWLYWIQSLIRGGRICYIDKELGRYRRHPNNVTNSENGVPIKNYQDLLATTVIVASESPTLTPLALKRQADLMRGLRWAEGGRRYGEYLRASLRLAFTWKSLILAGLNVFGIRR